MMESARLVHFLAELLEMGGLVARHRLVSRDRFGNSELCGALAEFLARLRLSRLLLGSHFCRRTLP